MNAKHIGQTFEKYACDYLTKQGLAVLFTNYTAPFIGEIDIIAMRDDELVFVEVKARKVGKFGSSLETVTPTKQRKITNTAMHFLQTHDEFAHMACRFDVIGFDVRDDDAQIEWIQHAFLVA